MAIYNVVFIDYEGSSNYTVEDNPNNSAAGVNIWTVNNSIADWESAHGIQPQMKTNGSGDLMTQSEAIAYLNLSNPADWSTANYFKKFEYDTSIVTNQALNIYFYPHLNISDPVINQKADILFYPDGNVSDPVINQEVKIQFFPDGNVADTAQFQEVKIEFYPDGNVTDVVTPITEDGFKFWFGMKGKKRYGKGFVRRINV